MFRSQLQPEVHVHRSRLGLQASTIIIGQSTITHFSVLEVEGTVRRARAS